MAFPVQFLAGTS